MIEKPEFKEKSLSDSEISYLKEGFISKNFNENDSEEKRNNIKKESFLLYKNDINIKHPKYFGRTRSLFFIGETPIFILGESCKNNSNNINI